MKLFILFFFVCLPTVFFAQKNLNVVYIDSSQPVTDDFLSSEEFVKLEKLVTSELDTSGLFVFYSNGPKYRFARSGGQRDEIIDLLLTGSAQEPNLMFDKKLLRDYLYTEVNGFSGTLDFHVFLSDHQAEEVFLGEAAIVKIFPKELYEVSNQKISQIDVHLYYSNTKGKLKEDKMLEVLQFFNNNDFGPIINYDVSILN
jgi:hypothetical protein